MPHPFELSPAELDARLDEMVDIVFGNLQSQFLVLPKKLTFVEYFDFQDAYECLKRYTNSFSNFSEEMVWKALREDALVLLVLRTILGVSPGEWAELARSERDSDASSGDARNLDVRVRIQRAHFRTMRPGSLSERRAIALVSVAVEYITRGAPAGADDTVHRLAKADTLEGVRSLQYVAQEDVPYAVLLYERYLGRPFASYRDSISGNVGDVMENAIEERLGKAGLTFRKTRRAERVPGFEQAPDFFVPTEFAPAVILEAKIAGDDGTARDKVARILRLASIRDDRLRSGQEGFEVVACIDGRGFGVRRQDMKQMLRATRGKVFTLASLDQLISHTRLKEFLPLPPE